MSRSETLDDVPEGAPSRSSWLPVAILLMGAVLTWWSWRTLWEESERQLRREVDAQAAAVHRELRARLEDRVRSLARMAARWQHDGRPTETSWSEEARAYYRDYSGYQALAWVDRDARVAWLVPQDGNEALRGVVLGKGSASRAANEAVAAALDTARATRTVQATEPVPLGRDGTGVFLFFPLYVGERFDGMLLAVVNHRALVRVIVSADIAPDFAVDVVARDHTVFTRGPAFGADDGPWSRELAIGLAPLPWRVRVWLPAPARAHRLSWYPAGVALGGACLTILLAVAVSAAQHASARKRSLERVHRRVVGTIEARLRAEASLAASELRFRRVVEHVGAVFWLWSRERRALEYVSPGYETIWGRTRESLYENPALWLEHVLPADRAIARIDATSPRFEEAYEDRCYRIVRPDGAIRWIHDRSFLFRDAAGAVLGVAGLAEDVTEQREAEALLQGEKEIFAMVADHAPLGETLAACCRLVESLTPGSQCAVMLRGPHANVLTCGAAPSLPPAYVEAVDRLAVAPTSGCCGASASAERPAIAGDVADDPLWAGCRTLAASHGIRASWSYPMVNRRGEILGTLAAHRTAIGEPSAHDVAVLERVRDLAAIAIEQLRAEDALRLTQFAVDHVADQIFLVAPDGRLLDVNPAACRRLGYSREELLTMRVGDINPDRPPDAWPATWGEVERRKHWRLETRHRAKSGEIYPVELTANYVDHEGQRYSYAIVRDVSEWKASLQALEESQERLRLATEAGHMGTWDWEAATQTLRYSPNLARLFGLVPEERTFGPTRFLRTIHPEDHTHVTDAVAATVRGEAVGATEFRVVWPDGTVHWVANHSRVHRDATGRSARIVGIVMDIEHRKHAERERETLLAELSAANAMLTRLSRQLLEVQENERRDLARDLHDEIGQCIAAAKMNLEVLARRAPALETQTPMADTVALLDHILQHVSRLCLELRPSVLDDLGLAAALRWYVHRQAERCGWEGHFHADELPTLSERMQGVCFRTVQEALTNVMRHAKAHKVEVALGRSGDQLVLRVADDGIGFDPGIRPVRTMTSGGLGLLGMRERVRSVGGEVSIDSTLGHGTVVEARIHLGADTAH